MPTMQSGSVRVLAIQELVDMIIDHVAQLAECSTGDLFCCALVAKPWVYRAQTHIFAHLDLSLTCYCSPASNAKCNSSLSSPDSERSTSSACAAVLSHKLHRLQNTLHTSPHLVRFVRRLSVPLNSVLLPSVALIPFTHLEDFTLECTSYPWAPCAPPSATHPIQTLLRHPRLRRVTLWGYLEPFSLIDTYFTNCARGIREVRLRLDNLNAYPDGCVTSPDGSAAVGGKIPLTHLSAPRELCGWLTTGRCPFEFSELRSLEVRAADWTALKPVFAPAFPLLQSLTLAPCRSSCLLLPL
ncbi:hypothetical protein C8J57DRAFT_420051 [Mycena rebaudengoi]|nr:hypothetical protein C8J57DRAFT_420051 [Mycena rebaudengoi]